MENKSVPISSKELSKGSKGLKSTSSKSIDSVNSLDYDPDVAERYTKLYDEKDGDIERIFDELGENPRKALKYPPKSAEEFGKKYAQGYYSCLDSK